MEEKIKDSRAIGDLKGFPGAVIDAMLDEQVRQGNERDVTVFQNDSCSGVDGGGFAWHYSIEGRDFWDTVIGERQFKEFFKLCGDLANFPTEIIDRMLNEQEWQGNRRDISVFRNDRLSGKKMGGFAWSESKEGHEFWENVIGNKQFDEFFKRYPKVN